VRVKVLISILSEFTRETPDRVRTSPRHWPTRRRFHQEKRRFTSPYLLGLVFGCKFCFHSAISGCLSDVLAAEPTNLWCRDVAQMIIATVQGGLIVSRVRRDKDTINRSGVAAMACCGTQPTR
jgi:hypothetical protein